MCEPIYLIEIEKTHTKIIFFIGILELKVHLSILPSSLIIDEAYVGLCAVSLFHICTSVFFNVLSSI